MQNREERMEEELNEDHVAEITASSTSFYAVRNFLFISTDRYISVFCVCLIPHLHVYTFFIFLGNWCVKCSQSLEPRPRSIYDVLDISVANGEPDQSKAVPKTKKTPKTVSVIFWPFVTSSVISVKTSSRWLVFYSLHRWCKPLNNRMKVYFSQSMRTSES